ncbi:carbamoyltransferase [bacterium]|nr:carbamoyltransferase [bacterium]
MIVLGISDNHGAGAAVVIDGRLVAAVNEERIDREKNSMAFPWGAIDACLSIAGVTPDDVDLVAVGSEFTPIFGLRLVKGWHRRVKRSAGQFSFLFDLYIMYHLLARAISVLRSIEIRLSRWWIGRGLRAHGYDCDVQLFDHHLCHAWSVYLTAPFDDAAVVTADAMGDGLSATVSIACAGRVSRIFAQDGRCAFNPYYSRITEYLGFIPNRHEGKVTGLAAYGDPSLLLDEFEKSAHFRGPGFSTFRVWMPNPRAWGLYRKIRGHRREDIAAACQRNLEAQMGRFVSRWLERTGKSRLALAGGIFENVKLNQRLHELSGVQEIYIFPNMSDGGLATGAALGASRRGRKTLETPYLGMAYGEDELEAAIRDARLEHERPDDLATAVARLVADRKIVARFDGGMEYGPRALGHRSILFRPDDPSANDWLNEKLRRSEFMPFAPAVRAERAPDLFVGIAGAEFTARFMNICFDCTDEMKTKCPGVVHVDGTARPQVFKRAEDALYYDILARFEDLTGLPAILNTSFNMHEEPIVATPRDAIRAFLAAGLDALALGPFLVRPRRKAANVDVH